MLRIKFVTFKICLVTKLKKKISFSSNQFDEKDFFYKISIISDYNKILFLLHFSLNKYHWIQHKTPTVRP